MATDSALLAVDITIAIIAILLIIIYSTNKKFRSFPCYFNIIFTLTITLDNLIRLIPSGKGDKNKQDIITEKTLACKMQAFTLTMFDKLMLTLMTSYSIIAYLGSYKLQFYKKKEKLIFIILTGISLVISIITTIIFYLQGISDRSQFCYVETKNIVKQRVDTIVTAFLFAITLFCIIKVLINIYYLKKERENDTREARKAINYHFCRFIFDFFISSITFIYVILLINKIINIQDESKAFIKDLIYVLLCLIVELFFTINIELIREVKRIITCQKDSENEYQETNTMSDHFNEDEGA